jgi:DNA repair protein RadC
MPVRIADRPSEERPRERLWKLGARALSDTELLALVIRDGTRGQSSLDVAASLLGIHGSLAELAEASPEELAVQPGVGVAKAAALVAALELAARLETGPAPLVVRGRTDLAAVAIRELRRVRREHVLAIVLGPGGRLRRVVPVSQGGAQRAPTPVREILNAVLRNDGVAFAVAHSHPSGDPTPSLEDRAASQRLVVASRAVGLRFLDHIVVTAGGRWAPVPFGGEAKLATHRGADG